MMMEEAAVNVKHAFGGFLKKVWELSCRDKWEISPIKPVRQHSTWSMGCGAECTLVVRKEKSRGHSQRNNIFVLLKRPFFHSLRLSCRLSKRKKRNTSLDICGVCGPFYGASSLLVGFRAPQEICPFSAARILWRFSCGDRVWCT